MDIFNRLAKYEHEQVIFCYDPSAGLKAIIAIHNTVLGPALGGCRMWNYESEEEALYDVLRLSRGMTYKAAVAGLNLGGGKAVIIGDPKKDKTEVLFRSFGRFVQGLGGRYITAEDVGTSVRDMEYVRCETDFVVGIPISLGGSGDPSPVTAYGVFKGIFACIEEVFNTSKLEGLKVSVQGVGHVGYYLVKHLVEAGAKVYISEIDPDKVKQVVKEFDVQVVSDKEIYSLDVDIFSPCALGAIINDETIPLLKCKIIAGAANNQLADEKIHGKRLMERGILYAPDYVINAGGLINVYNEFPSYDRDRALQQASNIYFALKKIFETSKSEGIPTYEASNRIAMERIAKISAVKNIYTGRSPQIFTRRS